MRFALCLVVMAPLCLVMSGCFGQLASLLARGPEAVARDMGTSVGYNAAGSLAGSELGQDVVAASDTVAGLDKILQEHPDAANSAELHELKRRLEEDIPEPGSQPEEGDTTIADHEEFKPGDPVMTEAVRPESRHDRRQTRIDSRQGPQALMLDESHMHFAGTRTMAVHNRLRIEPPTTPNQRWRRQDPHRFTSPRQTSFHEKIPLVPMEGITGVHDGPIPIDGVVLPSSMPYTPVK